MVKQKVKCPSCKDPILDHDEVKALECFNELSISKNPIEMKNVRAVGYAHAGLKGVGQLHGDKNIITMNFGGNKPEITITPDLLILQKCLLSKVKKEKKSDEGSKGTAKESSKDSGHSEEPAP